MAAITLDRSGCERKGLFFLVPMEFLVPVKRYILFFRKGCWDSRNGQGLPTFSATGNIFFPPSLSSKYTHEIYETKVRRIALMACSVLTGTTQYKYTTTTTTNDTPKRKSSPNGHEK